MAKMTSLSLVFLLFFAVLPGTLSATFTFTNNCPEAVYPAVLNSNSQAFPTTGFQLDPGASFTQDNVPAGWSGRIWGRFRCSTDASGRFVCESGDCASGKIACNGAGGIPPATFAEFILQGVDGKDFYDVSNVDGFNLPMEAVPAVAGCETTSCPANILTSCPDDMAVMGSGGVKVGCKNACLMFNTDEYCCRGQYVSPAFCKPSNYSLLFKQLCPLAYSFAYDDKSSTLTCTGANYHITFCPQSPSQKLSDTPKPKLPSNPPSRVAYTPQPEPAYAAQSKLSYNPQPEDYTSQPTLPYKPQPGITYIPEPKPAYTSFSAATLQSAGLCLIFVIFGILVVFFNSGKMC